jgi:hypothetical protein
MLNYKRIGRSHTLASSASAELDARASPQTVSVNAWLVRKYLLGSSLNICKAKAESK